MKYAIKAVNNPCGTATDKYSIRFAAWYLKNEFPVDFGTDINDAYCYRERQANGHKYCKCVFEVVEV